MCMWHGQEKAGGGGGGRGGMKGSKLTNVCKMMEGWQTEFAGEQKDTDLINLTDVYLLHCLVFCNLSQHTSISSSYH